MDLGGVCGTGWGLEWAVGVDRGVEGVESGVRVLWMEELVPWRRKSPKKVVDQREREIER